MNEFNPGDRAMREILKQEDAEFITEVNRVIKEAEPETNEPTPRRLSDGRVIPRDFRNRKAQPIVKNRRKPGRNEPCSCNSGKKYKHCCFKASFPQPYFTPRRRETPSIPGAAMETVEAPASSKE